eukprot:gene15762-biopygen4991
MRYANRRMGRHAAPRRAGIAPVAPAAMAAAAVGFLPGQQRPAWPSHPLRDPRSVQQPPSGLLLIVAVAFPPMSVPFASRCKCTAQGCVGKGRAWNDFACLLCFAWLVPIGRIATAASRGCKGTRHVHKSDSRQRLQRRQQRRRRRAMTSTTAVAARGHHSAAACSKDHRTQRMAHSAWGKELGVLRTADCAQRIAHGQRAWGTAHSAWRIGQRSWGKEHGPKSMGQGA